GIVADGAANHLARGVDLAGRVYLVSSTVSRIAVIGSGQPDWRRGGSIVDPGVSAQRLGGAGEAEGDADGLPGVVELNGAGALVGSAGSENAVSAAAEADLPG